jgi:DNA-directed RNA polymerase specialized sigma24 family protein
VIEPFWDVLRRFSTSEKSPPEPVEEPSHQKNSEDSFLAALPVVRKIVRRRFVSLRQAEALDLEQGIILRLLNWREKYREKSERMSESDWKAFAARAAYNETHRHFSKNAASNAMYLPLDIADEIESPLPFLGDSDVEFKSLAYFVWQETCQLSLRQKRALLLHSRKLIVYFLTGGITDEELAQSLEISETEWLDIKTKLPLSNASIAQFVVNENKDDRRSLESVINSIKKARHEARGKLRLLTNK